MTATSIERLGWSHDARSRIWLWATATQAAWTERIDNAMGDRTDPGGAILRGIVTGERGDIPSAVNQRWRICGIFHALSVSGLHLAVVAGIAFWLLRKLMAASPWGGRIRPALWAAAPALALAIAYTLITGAQIATLRSLVVVVIAIVGQAIDRPLRLIDALGIAAIALLAITPDDIRDPSFQLSFVAAVTLGLVPARQPRIHGWLRHWLTRSATTSLWVTIATAPITAYHFHEVAIGGIVGNLALTPLLELVALPVGLAGTIASAVFPSVGAVAIRGAAIATGIVDTLADKLALITPIGSVAVASATIMVTLIALSLLSVRAPAGRVAAALWCSLCLVWSQATPPPPADAVRVTFLDVGQGDAALIELPDGAAWLIDAGGFPNRRTLASASAPGQAIRRALQASGHTKLDLVVISHPHPDHYLGLAGLAIPVAELWTAADEDVSESDSPPPANPTRNPLPSFTAIARAVGAPIRHPPLGVARSQAGAELIVWGPRFSASQGAPEREAVDPVRSVNDNSLVVELRYAGRSILLPGDIEAEGEANLVAAGIGHVDVVKVPHHGSPTSSSEEFIAATRPSVAVISCGAGNSFGFPSGAVIERWKAAGASVERTDVHAAITVTIAKSGELTVDRFAED